MQTSTMRTTAVALCLLLAVTLSHAARLDRCQIVSKLRNGGITSDLRNWVCLVEAESSGQTHKRGGPNKNGSYDYGLFQINSKYWCGIGKAGGDCHIKCEDLLNDNLSDDITCAKKVHKRHGFDAWYGWKNKCKGKSLPDISRC